MASTQIGLALANKLKKRTEELRAIKLAFAAIETEITFARLPLGKIFTKISANLPKNLAAVFQQTGEEIQQKTGRTTAEIFNEKLMQSQLTLHLTPTDIQHLKESIVPLGKSDLDNSLKSLKLAQTTFASLEQDAKEIYERNSKLHLTLSVCGGLALTILMI